MIDMESAVFDKENNSWPAASEPSSQYTGLIAKGLSSIPCACRVHFKIWKVAFNP